MTLIIMQSPRSNVAPDEYITELQAQVYWVHLYLGCPKGHQPSETFVYELLTSLTS